MTRSVSWPTISIRRLVSVLYLSMRCTVLLFIRAPFYVLFVFVAMCSVFWLFWLSYKYLPSDWLERLIWRSLIVARGLSSPESPGRRMRVIFLVYCIVSLLHCALSLAAQCIVISPVCDSGVCNGRAGGVRTLLQPARAVFASLWALFHFIMYLCCLLPLRDIFSYFYGAI